MLEEPDLVEGGLLRQDNAQSSAGRRAREVSQKKISAGLVDVGPLARGEQPRKLEECVVSVGFPLLRTLGKEAGGGGR